MTIAIAVCGSVNVDIVAFSERLPRPGETVHVDSVQTGFRPMVIREAVGDRSKPAHDQSLFDMDAKYADVISLQDASDYLKGRAAA